MLTTSMRDPTWLMACPEDLIVSRRTIPRFTWLRVVCWLASAEPSALRKVNRTPVTFERSSPGIVNGPLPALRR